MRVIDELRALLRPAPKKKQPTSAEIAGAVSRAGDALREAEAKLAQLRRERADVLLLGTAEALQEHDAATKATAEEVEALRALIPRLRELAAEAQVREAIQGVPALLGEVPAAIEAMERAAEEFRAARTAFDALLSRLRHAATVIRSAKSVPTDEIPVLDEALEARIEAVARLQIVHESGPRALEWPRRRPQAPDKYVIVDGTGEFRFVGDWTEAERRRVIREHGGLRPRSYDFTPPAGSLEAAAAAAARSSSAADAAAAARILHAGKR